MKLLQLCRVLSRPAVAMESFATVRRCSTRLSSHMQGCARRQTEGVLCSLDLALSSTHLVSSSDGSDSMMRRNLPNRSTNTCLMSSAARLALARKHVARRLQMSSSTSSLAAIREKPTAGGLEKSIGSFCRTSEGLHRIFASHAIDPDRRAQSDTKRRLTAWRCEYRLLHENHHREPVTSLQLHTAIVDPSERFKRGISILL